MGLMLGKTINKTIMVLVGLIFISFTGPVHAGAIGSCAKLRSFFLNFQTGGDDLRSNSEVIIWLMTNTGDVELQHVWGGFGNNSTNYRVVTLQNANWDVNSCSVTGIKMRMISHNSWTETDDNWNMDGIVVNGYSDQGEYKYTFSANGSPVKRFTGSSQWWERWE